MPKSADSQREESETGEVPRNDPGPNNHRTTPPGSEWGSYSYFGVSPSDDPMPKRSGRNTSKAGKGPLSEDTDEVLTPKGDAFVDVDCLFIGPSGVGKTSLIAALDQGCLVSGDHLSFIHLTPDESLSELGVAAARSMRSRRRIDHPPTSDLSTHSFLVGHSSRHGQHQGLKVRIHEIPESYLQSDDAERTDNLYSRIGASATCLVLCIDANLEITHDWLTIFPLLLAKLRIPTLRSAETNEVAWSLPFDRVLVVVTKADLLVEKVARELTKPTTDPFLTSLTREITDWRSLAYRIEPLHLALSIIELSTFRRLLRALRRNSSLAIGFVSAQGEPSRNANGARQSTWTPFGLANVVEFIARGVAAGAVSAVLPGEAESFFD